MGNALRCFKGEDDDHGGRDHYRPTFAQSTAVPPPTHHQLLGPHGFTTTTDGVAALDQYIHNFKSTSMVTYTVLYFPFPPPLSLLAVRHCSCMLLLLLPINFLYLIL
jgi:hypothetical protein